MCEKSELNSELRNKFYSILKSHYWEAFEEGKCMPDSIIILLESADRSMDDDTVEMCDWDEYLKSYLLSSSTLHLYIKLS